MVKIKNPLMSLKASGSIARILTFVRRGGVNLAEKKPELKDARSEPQLGWRHMFTKCVDLWHTLSAAEKQEWESAARPRHMTGYAWYISQCLRPNPGIYLPLQGGTMQGIIDMAGYKIEDLLDPAAAQDADTKAARDAAIATAIGGSLTCDVYAWTGASWQKQLLESAAHHNLRVKLFDGANGIDSGRLDLDATTERGLFVKAGVMGVTGVANVDYIHALTTAIGLISPNKRQLVVAAYCFGLDGANLTLLRTYPGGILKVGRAHVGLLDTRVTGTGQVGAVGARKLYWMLLNPSAGNSLIVLTDAIAAGAAIKADHFDTARDGHMITFDPPLEFSTGIYVETFTNMTSVIFGYL